MPEGRRSFGYFALPLLVAIPGVDAAIVGRLDAKAERRRGVLLLRRLFLEAPDTVATGLSRVEYATLTASALKDFAIFNGAEEIELERFESPDGRLERSLRAALARLT